MNGIIWIIIGENEIRIRKSGGIDLVSVLMAVQSEVL